MCLQSARWAHLCRYAMGQWRMYYMGTYIVCIFSRTSRRPKALQDINNMLHIVCIPLDQLKWLNLCRDAIGQWRMCFMRSYVVCICSWISQRPKALQDINNILHKVCMPVEPAGMAEPLQRCNWWMMDVLYEVLIVCICSWSSWRVKALQSYNWDTI